jgi:glycosyltransferase involved in cell wall biosynthesis
MMLKNNLIFVTSYEFVDTNATKARISAFLNILKKDYGITILCPGQNHNKKKESFSIINLPQNQITNNLVLRTFIEVLYSIKILLMVKNIRPRQIIITVPSMFLLILLIRKQSTIIVDIRDIVWEYLPEKRWYQRLLKYFLRKIMLKLINRASGIFITNQVERNFSSFIEIVSNGINIDRYEKISNYKLNYDEKKCNILYVGNIGIAQNLSILVDAISELPMINVNIIGKGNDLNRVKQYATENGVKNMKFLGGMAWDDLEPYYAKSNILYAQISSAYDTAIPSKLYEYLSIGTSVIFAGVGPSIDLAGKFENTITIPPDNPEALTQAIKSLSKKPKQISNSNKNMIRDNYIRERQVEKVMPLIHHVFVNDN